MLTLNNKLVIAALLCAGIINQAGAGNGLNDGATGIQSAGLANADLTLTNDTSAININPAGLSRIEHSHLDFIFEPVLYTVSHEDSIGGKTDLENDTLAVFSGGYARRLNNHWVAGIGMFFQGGVGFEYDEMPNAFGDPDEFSSLSGAIKIAPGVSWEVSDRLTLGGAIAILYSTAEQDLLPNTSSPDFQGFRIRDLEGISTNFRLGLLYQFTPALTVAATYTSEAPIRLKDGNMEINRSHADLAPLRYQDVAIKGLNFAAETSVGIAYSATEDWTLALDLTWSEWASAMTSVLLTASEPDDPSAPATLVSATPQDWRDHLLVALGTEYRWNPDTLVRLGVSFARSPQQDVGLSPANNLLADLTLGAGIAYDLNPRWQLKGSLIWQPEKSQTYYSPLFGGEAEETFGAYALYLGFARRW
jgi:long-chain fatty acid transport protein